MEVGFDVLHFVATRNASNWLIHSTRLPTVEGDSVEEGDSLSGALSSNKKQRLDPLVDDTKKDNNKDDDAEIITIGDSDSEVEEVYPPNSSHKSKGRQRQTPRKDSSKEHDKQSRVDETLEVNKQGGEEEDGEPSDESGKRKRPASPTVW